MPTKSIATKTIQLGLAACALHVAGCANESTPEVATPDVDLAALAEQTEGDTYNGWTVAPYAGSYGTTYWWGINLAKNSGSDATRGAGACLVGRPYASVSCTSNSSAGDAYCTSMAQAAFGTTNTHGYCYQSLCYYKPPSATDEFCIKHPARTPGSYPGEPSKLPLALSRLGGNYSLHALGCMSKEPYPGAPETPACATGNPDVFMRTVVAATTVFWQY